MIFIYKMENEKTHILYLTLFLVSSTISPNIDKKQKQKTSSKCDIGKTSVR